MINDMVEQGTALHVRPSKNIHVSRFKGDVDKCQELYDLGYRDMEERRQDILQFLGRE
jgi:predicted patatin/cPLA2 family phospholipase